MIHHTEFKKFTNCIDINDPNTLLQVSRAWEHCEYIMRKKLRDVREVLAGEAPSTTRITKALSLMEEL